MFQHPVEMKVLKLRGNCRPHHVEKNEMVREMLNFCYNIRTTADTELIEKDICAKHLELLKFKSAMS